jgi:hypothetical protein
VRAQPGDHGRGTVRLEAGQGGIIGAKQPTGLLGGRGEYLGRWHPMRGQHGDTAERGLLLQTPTELDVLLAGAVDGPLADPAQGRHVATSPGPRSCMACSADGGGASNRTTPSGVVRKAAW